MGKEKSRNQSRSSCYFRSSSMGVKWEYAVKGKIEPTLLSYRIRLKDSYKKATAAGINNATFINMLKRGSFEHFLF